MGEREDLWLTQNTGAEKTRDAEGAMGVRVICPVEEGVGSALSFSGSRTYGDGDITVALNRLRGRASGTPE